MLVWDNKPLIYGGKFFVPYNLITRTVSTLTSNNGSISTNKPSGHKDDIITVSNTASQYYQLTGYNITGSTMTGNTFKIGDENVSIQGVFAPIKYNVSYINDGHGSLNGGVSTATGGSTTTLTATPDSYYSFKNYQVTGGSIAGNTLTITSNCTAKANFSANKYTMTYQNDGHGTLTGNITTATGGQIVNLTATPSPYYAFKNYQITGGTINGNTVTITSNCTARANFSAINYSVSYTNDGHGTLTGGFNTATGGQTTTLTATPSNGYVFKNYQVTGGTINSNTLTVTGNCTARANFSAKPVRTLTLQQTSGGTITANKTTGYDNDTVTLSNTPSANYNFVQYNITGATLTGSQFKFNNSDVTANVTWYKEPVLTNFSAAGILLDTYPSQNKTIELNASNSSKYFTFYDYGALVLTASTGVPSTWTSPLSGYSAFTPVSSNYQPCSGRLYASAMVTCDISDGSYVNYNTSNSSINNIILEDLDNYYNGTINCHGFGVMTIPPYTMQLGGFIYGDNNAMEAIWKSSTYSKNLPGGFVFHYIISGLATGTSTKTAYCSFNRGRWFMSGSYTN